MNMQKPNMNHSLLGIVIVLILLAGVYFVIPPSEKETEPISQTEENVEEKAPVPGLFHQMAGPICLRHP